MFNNGISALRIPVKTATGYGLKSATDSGRKPPVVGVG